MAIKNYAEAFGTRGRLSFAPKDRGQEIRFSAAPAK